MLHPSATHNNHRACSSIWQSWIQFSNERDRFTKVTLDGFDIEMGLCCPYRTRAHATSLGVCRVKYSLVTRNEDSTQIMIHCFESWGTCGWKVLFCVCVFSRQDKTRHINDRRVRYGIRFDFQILGICMVRARTQLSCVRLSSSLWYKKWERKKHGNIEGVQ